MMMSKLSISNEDSNGRRYFLMLDKVARVFNTRLVETLDTMSNHFRQWYIDTQSFVRHPRSNPYTTTPKSLRGRHEVQGQLGPITQHGESTAFSTQVVDSSTVSFECNEVDLLVMRQQHQWLFPDFPALDAHPDCGIIDFRKIGINQVATLAVALEEETDNLESQVGSVMGPSIMFRIGEWLRDMLFSLASTLYEALTEALMNCWSLFSKHILVSVLL